MRIGIAGAGGIGSNVAFQLVRSGMRHLKIVDFDTIEPSNLNRQFYFADQVGLPKAATLARNLERIDPQVTVEALQQRLDAGNMAHTFLDVDVVVEGFDGAQDKKILLETFAGTHKLVVSACGVAGLDVDAITTQTMGNCHIVGDFITVAGTDNLYAPKVIMVASIMSRIVLKHYLPGGLK
jgi:sulfur carrier protein ThiS adenylyltransferase